MFGESKRLLRIFVASPKDIIREREEVREVVSRLRSHAQRKGYDLDAVGWKTHATPGIGNPQSLINPLVEDSDLFIGILWRRFGQATINAESGTIEEYELARKNYCAKGKPEIMFYFREIHPDFLDDPGQQLKKVLDFKKTLEKNNDLFFWEYTDPSQFGKLFEQHLINWLDKLDLKSTKTLNIPTLNKFKEHLHYCRTELQNSNRPLSLNLLKLPPLFLEMPNCLNTRKMKVRDAIKKYPHLIILGNPGAGKTTALKILAEEYAGWHGEEKNLYSNVSEALQGLNDFNLPIFIDLATYAPLVSSNPNYSLIQLITDSVRGVKKVDVLNRLVNGGCILLFDGLNEVGEVYNKVVHQLRYLANKKIPNNRFIVTCRPTAYRDELRNDFTTFYLSSLSKLNVSKILELELGIDKAQTAWKAIDEHIKDLCSNPLMLTILVDELRNTNILPHNCAQLFNRFLDRYLTEWAGIKGAVFVRVEKEILSALALHLGVKQTLLSADEAAEAMSKRLLNLQRNNEAPQDFNIASLNNELLNHGLLREYRGQTGFFHQAIQEYFISREIASQKNKDLLWSNISNPLWSEIIVFISGIVNNATEIIRRLIDLDPFLATKCVDNAKQIDGEIVDKLALIMIEKIKEKSGKDTWYGRVYPEMNALLSLEAKTKTKGLTELFLRVYGQSFSALYDLAHVLLFMNYPERAILLLEPIIAEHPNEINLKGVFGWALRQNGRYKESIATLEGCLEFNPNSGWLWVQLGVTYENMNCWEDAKKCFDRAVSVEPQLSWAHYHLGLSLKRENDYMGCLNHIQEAIRLNPRDARPHIILSEICLEYLKKPDEAISEYKKAMNYEQNQIAREELVFFLAEAFKSAGNNNEAGQKYQEYLDHNPWGRYAKRCLEMLEIID